MNELTTPVGETFTFQSPWTIPPNDQPDSFYRDRNGTQAVVTAHLTAENGPHKGWDDEVLPVYTIRFLSDGLTIDAWPEEVEPFKTAD